MERCCQLFEIVTVYSNTGSSLVELHKNAFHNDIDIFGVHLKVSYFDEFMVNQLWHAIHSNDIQLN